MTVEQGLRARGGDGGKTGMPLLFDPTTAMNHKNAANTRIFFESIPAGFGVKIGLSAYLMKVSKILTETGLHY